MKATELIEKLQKIVAENGDVEIELNIQSDYNHITGDFDVENSVVGWIINENF